LAIKAYKKNQREYDNNIAKQTKNLSTYEITWGYQTLVKKLKMTLPIVTHDKLHQNTH
jgi:hypothetical protein